jgi:hypothetical protein
MAAMETLLKSKDFFTSNRRKAFGDDERFVFFISDANNVSAAAAFETTAKRPAARPISDFLSFYI